MRAEQEEGQSKNAGDHYLPDQVKREHIRVVSPFCAGHWVYYHPSLWSSVAVSPNQGCSMSLVIDT